MAGIRKGGKSYQITVSNGRDIHDKQILETTTWTPDPDKTEKQNQKALERFAMDFEDKAKSGRYLKGEKMTCQEYSALWLSEYAEKQMERTSIERCESSLDGIILPAIGHLKLSEIQPLHLSRLYHELAENGYVQNTKAPKTFSSNRTVTLPAGTMNLIRKYKSEQQRYRLSLGTYWKGNNYLFIQDDGKQMDLSTPNKVFQKVIRLYNESHEDKLPEITLHGLRHTSATLLIAQNVDVKTVSSRLGHSETSTTMDIYAHALKKQDALAAESLGELFTEKSKKQC